MNAASRRTCSTFLLLILAGCASPNFFSGMAQAKRQTSNDQFLTRNAQLRRDSSRGAGTVDDPSVSPASSNFNASRAPAGGLAQAEQFEQAGQLAEAAAAYEDILRSAPNHAHAHHRLAIIADKQERFAEAERHYLAALKQSPNNTDLLSDLGYSYLLQGRLELSEQALAEALVHDRTHRKALYNLGALNGQRGNYDQALALFRQAGSEADAQAAVARFLPPRGVAGVPPAALAAAPQNPFDATRNAYPPAGADLQQAPLAQDSRPALADAADDPKKSQMNEATRKFVEEFRRERAALQAQQAKAAHRGHPGPQPRGSAPLPGNQRPVPTAGIGENSPVAGSDAARAQAARDYLNSDGAQAGHINQLFSEMDARPQAERPLANVPRQVDSSRDTSRHENLPQMPPNASQVGWGSGPPVAQWSDPASTMNVPGQAGSPSGSYPAASDTNPWQDNRAQPAWNDPRAGNVQMANVQPTNAVVSAPVPAATSRAAWERAQIVAAQMGLNAGSGLGQMLGDNPGSPGSAPDLPGFNPPEIRPQGFVPQGTPPPGNDQRGMISPDASRLPPPPAFDMPAREPGELPAWPGRQVQQPGRVSQPLNAPPPFPTSPAGGYNAPAAGSGFNGPSAAALPNGSRQP